MIVVILTIIIIAVIIGLLWYASTKKKDEKIPAKNTLTITKDGASTSSTSEAQSGREGYMKMPRSMKPCHTGETDGITGTAWCDSIGYDKDKHGMAYFYDLEFSAAQSHRFHEDCEETGSGAGAVRKCKEVVACPDGGFDCAFTEEFDSNGALIGITDSEGIQLLDVMANDAWDGKWDDWSSLNDEVKRLVEWKDGKLVLISSNNFGTAGTEWTLLNAMKNDVPPTLYFVALLSSMKMANEEKPDEIILQVEGAKGVFDNVILNPVVMEGTGTDVPLKAPSTPGVVHQPDQPE
jgi:hypothetical protein